MLKSALSDWRTTLWGVLVAAILIATLFARPGWGAEDIAKLVASAGALLLGLVTTLPKPAPEAPAAPPAEPPKP